MARPRKCRCICAMPAVKGLQPIETPARGELPLGYDEYEVIRLLDYEGLSQEECARRMEVSRPTVTRIYEAARRKLAEALVNGRRLVLEPGDVVVCPGPRPECAHNRACCHRRGGGAAGEQEETT